MKSGKHGSFDLPALQSLSVAEPDLSYLTMKRDLRFLVKALRNIRGLERTASLTGRRH